MDKSGSSKDDICRDFLRNVCHRGKGCKYHHPNDQEAKALGKKEEPKFCHDFQNSECLRRSCRFIHCSKEEEEMYKNSETALEIVPVCKDFLNGECQRSLRCKFRHVSPSKRQWEPSYPREAYPPSSYGRFDEGGYEPPEKRFIPQSSDYGQCDPFAYQSPAIPDYYLRLEGQNKQLLQQVAELKKQVASLTSTNEFLLGQNALMHVKEMPASSMAMAGWTSTSRMNSETNWQNGYSWR